MKRALVTGGTGFIGNHLVAKLLSLGIEVDVLDKSIHKPTHHPIDKANLIEGDVLSHNVLRDCLQTVDTCFHLAALSSVPACSRDWIFSHENNVLAFNGLLEELRIADHKIKLIYASSAAVYGNNAKMPLAESEHIVPNSPYGADKLSNEIYAEVMQSMYGLPSIGLRLFNVYGLGQLESNHYCTIMAAFKHALHTNQSLKIYGDGEQSRDFIYVEDIVDAFIAAARSDYEHSGIYNVCRGEAISVNEVVNMMMDISGQKVPLSYEKSAPGDLRASCGDPSLMAKELHFRAKTSIEEGLKKFLR